MKALTLTEVKSPLSILDSDSLSPSSGEVVIKVGAASLNRRDFWITQGLYPGIEPPVVLGSDACGVVELVGEGVDSKWAGKEVVVNPGLEWGEATHVQSSNFHILGLPTDGTLATEVKVPASQLFEKPPHLSVEQAAALPLAGVTAYRALFTQGNLKAGERVLISGIGGGVATFALQFALAAGAKVCVTSSDPEKLKQAVSRGASAGFNYKEEKWEKQMVAEFGAPNLVIDSAGGAGYLGLLNAAALGGRIVNYGATAGNPEKLDMFKLFWKQLRLIGSTMGSPEDFQMMIEFVSKHKLEPIVDRVVSFEEADGAVASMKKSPQFGKIVVKINAEL